MIYLTVTAHPDDEVLGFGGSCYTLTQQENKVYNCMLSGSVEARRFKHNPDSLNQHIENAQNIIGAGETFLGNFPNIKFNTVPHLDLVQYIEGVIEKVQPDYIFTHHPNDLNNDHYHTSKACQAASRLYQRKKLKPLKGLFYMEIPSSTDWSFPGNSSNFTPNTFIEIGKIGLEAKLRALSAYKDVMRDYPHPRSTETIEGLAAFRGSQVGRMYCESFEAAMNIIGEIN